MSASIIPANGAGPMPPASMTRMPWSGPLTPDRPASVRRSLASPLPTSSISSLSLHVVGEHYRFARRVPWCRPPVRDLRESVRRSGHERDVGHLLY
jgi:hypothetical protein